MNIIAGNLRWCLENPKWSFDYNSIHIYLRHIYLASLDMSAHQINMKYPKLEMKTISKPGNQEHESVNISDLYLLSETNSIGNLRESKIAHIVQKQLLTCLLHLHGQNVLAKWGSQSLLKTESNNLIIF